MNGLVSHALHSVLPVNQKQYTSFMANMDHAQNDLAAKSVHISLRQVLLASFKCFIEGRGGKNDWRVSMAVTKNMTQEAESATKSDQAECKLKRHP